MTTDNPQTGVQNQNMENQPDMENKPEMCCDGQQTAEEHRKSSHDGKCCIDG